MKILDIPKEGRPRERFKKLGPEALSDVEIFAKPVFLNFSCQLKKVFF